MKKKILLGLLTLVIIVGGLGLYGYSILSTGFGIDKTVYIYIDSKRDYKALLKELEDTAKLESVSNFDLLASALSYKDNVKTGRYAVNPNMNISDFIKILRNGSQTPIKLKFNNLRLKEDLVQRIGEQLMLDEKDLLDALNNVQKCQELGFDTQTIVAMFIPNTYEIYWDINLNSFLQRMKTEYNNFWTDKRMSRSREIGLTPIEVSILASIVEEECTYAAEYPVVAGLYLNRIKIGQPLQADPTVKFAVGDFSLRRILFKHLEIDSPYNTYQHQGLPPGPIRIPSIKGIDAVLNHTEHKFLYMCSKEDFSGYHNFAETHAEHERNAARYRRELNARKIYK